MHEHVFLIQEKARGVTVLESWDPFWVRLFHDMVDERTTPCFNVTLELGHPTQLPAN